MKYKQIILIELETQFPITDVNEFAKRVQTHVGEWCLDSRVVRFNEELKEGTA